MVAVGLAAWTAVAPVAGSGAESAATAPRVIAEGSSPGWFASAPFGQMGSPRTVSVCLDRAGSAEITSVSVTAPGNLTARLVDSNGKPVQSVTVTRVCSQPSADPTSGARNREADQGLSEATDGLVHVSLSVAKPTGDLLTSDVALTQLPRTLAFTYTAGGATHQFGSTETA